MNERQLFEAIGRVDDDLILAADRPAVRRRKKPLMSAASPYADEGSSPVEGSTDGTYKAEDSTESSIAIAPAHAVILEGVIYYDTCTVSGTDAKAAPDGTITSTVDSDSFPTEDGQSNFGTGYAYRYGSENGTLEVQIDGEWWIFAANQ